MNGMPRKPVREEGGVPMEGIPVLHLGGFDGPMDLLCDLAERQRIDLGRFSILALAEQFAATLQQLGDRVATERKADWLVMATRLVLLRSRLLFPENPKAAEAARRDAEAELRRIDELAHMRAAAAWLDGRPALGRDVFARGHPEWLETSGTVRHEIDVIAFLWASLELFSGDDADVEAAPAYRPFWQNLHSIPEAYRRIRLRLATTFGPQPLDCFLPEDPGGADAADPALVRRRSAWTSVFAASLELAKQGKVALAQDGNFGTILLDARPAERSAEPSRGIPAAR